MTRDGARLVCRDFGGGGPPVLMLHGLAGHAREWDETASWLTARCRVVALDARGHGHSERAPADVSPDAHVADAALVVEKLGLAPVVVVGQSMGALTAMSLAARRPELLRGLVVVDASPIGGREAAKLAAAALGEALRSWPVPFGSKADAEGFFTKRFGGPVAADAWTRGLEERHDGWWPRFDVEVVVQTMREAIAGPRWEEWERVSCPALVVRAGNGLVESHLAQEMVTRLPGTVLVELPGAFHDLHLDQPGRWRLALTGFLDALDREPG